MGFAQPDLHEVDHQRLFLVNALFNPSIEGYIKLYKLLPEGPHLNGNQEFVREIPNLYGFQQKILALLTAQKLGRTSPYTAEEIFRDIEGIDGITLHKVRDPDEFFPIDERGCLAFFLSKDPLFGRRSGTLVLPSEPSILTTWGVSAEQATQLFLLFLGHEAGHAADWMYGLKKMRGFEFSIHSETRQQYFSMLAAYAMGITEKAQEHAEVVKWFLGDRTGKDLAINQLESQIIQGKVLRLP